MNLQPLNVPETARHFTTYCIRCNKVVGSWDHIKIDLDGCPLRSYYCEACAQVVTPEEAAKLAEVARKLVHTNA